MDSGGLLPDVQSEADLRGVELQKVGISGLRYPISFNDGSTASEGVAELGLYVHLSHDRRGAHLSRMVEVVDELLRELRPQDLSIFLKAAATRLEVETLEM